MARALDEGSLQSCSRRCPSRKTTEEAEGAPLTKERKRQEGSLAPTPLGMTEGRPYSKNRPDIRLGSHGAEKISEEAIGRCLDAGIMFDQRETEDIQIKTNCGASAFQTGQGVRQ